MEKERKETIRDAINLLGSTNNLLKAVIDEDKKDIIFWQRSVKSWGRYLNKKIDRYLKEKKEEEIPF